MLHQIYSYSRLGDAVRERTQRAVESGGARLNPWLLWRPEAPQAPQVLTVAELAECHCPDICDRDHANE